MIYFQSLSIDFELFDLIRIQINQICLDNMVRNNKFGSKKSIKRRFESKSSQTLGLSLSNRLSLVSSTKVFEQIKQKDKLIEERAWQLLNSNQIYKENVISFQLEECN